MKVGKEKWKNFPQIPWVKKGMRKEMKREPRNEVKKEMKKRTHTFQQKVGVFGKMLTMTLLIQMLGSLLQVDM
jgi:hypothetical protein